MEDYFLGGRKIPWWIIGFSGMASNLDVTGTMVITSMFLLLGIKGYWVGFRGAVVLSLAFLMVFMGKWHRRSGVITTAEWMEFRFGSGKAGEVARLTNAIATIVMGIGMIAYFSVGVGFFLEMFLPFPRQVCALIIIAVALVYVVLGGLSGVIYSDLVQGCMVGFTTLYISVLAFTHVDIPTLTALAPGGAEWFRFRPTLEVSLPLDYAMYNLIGLCVMMWLAKAILEGLGGPSGGYMAQRFYAAGSDKECGKLTAMWIALFTLRWPMIIGLAMLGITMAKGMITSPELTLPMVIGTYFQWAYWD